MIPWWMWLLLALLGMVVLIWPDRDGELRGENRMSAENSHDAQIAAIVPREAFERLMLEYLESEGKNPTAEALVQVCDDWLESHAWKAARRIAWADGKVRDDLLRPDHGGGMFVPIEGCECEACMYARYWNALSYEDRKRELEMMAQYAEEQRDA